jgi:ribosomal protein L24
VSNVQVVDTETKKPTRVGYKRGDGDRKVRVTRASGKEI